MYDQILTITIERPHAKSLRVRGIRPLEDGSDFEHRYFNEAFERIPDDGDLNDPGKTALAGAAFHWFTKYSEEVRGKVSEIPDAAFKVLGSDRDVALPAGPVFFVGMDLGAEKIAAIGHNQYDVHCVEASDDN